MKALADSGVFYLDGVLLGAQAFTVLGNLLGCALEHSALRTQDIDIGGMAAMSIALPDLKADVPKALDGLEMGFIPVPPFNPKHPSTSFSIRGNPFRVDVLTHGKASRKRASYFYPSIQCVRPTLAFS